MRKLKLAWVALLLIGSVCMVSGCATQTLWAGPVITSISPAGDGKAIVEKCMVKITEDRDYWSGSSASSAGLADCSSHEIVLVPE